MGLLVPNYIIDANVATNLIHYYWDEWSVKDYFIEVEEDQFERLDDLSDAANLAQADLPVWVQKIAPPEVQAEIEEDVEPSVRVNPPSLKTPSSGVESLDAGLLARLSAAMDSDEELELTPEMLVEYADQLEEPPIVPDTRPYDVPPPAELLAETAVPRPAVGLEDPEAVKPLARHNTDFWMVLLILAFIVVAVVLVVAIITML